MATDPYKYGPLSLARKRLERAHHGTAIVSYSCADGRSASIVGQGSTLAARVADADAQLPAGEWTREAVSTPMSIYSDLVGRRVPESHRKGVADRPMAYPRYERKAV